MAKNIFKIVIADLEMENWPPCDSDIYRNVGTNFERRNYLVNSPLGEIDLDLQIWQLNLKHPRSRELFPNYIVDSHMYAVLVDLDKFRTDDYRESCVQTIKQMEEICKSKPTIIMWGSDDNQFIDSGMDEYPVVYERCREDALVSAFKIVASNNIKIQGKKIFVPLEKLNFKLKSRCDSIGNIGYERFERIELEKERETIKKLHPDINIADGNYQLVIDPSLFGLKNEGERRVILEISERGNSCFYDPKINRREIFVCLTPNCDGNATFFYDNKPYNFSAGGSIALSVADYIQEKSANRINKEYDKKPALDETAITYIKTSLQKVLEK